MANPILNALTNLNQMSEKINLINQIKNGDVNAIYNNMIKSNPQFKNFIDSTKGKSVDEIAKEYGVDLSMLNQFLR